MKKLLLIALAFVIFLGIIFGITFIGELAPESKEEASKEKVKESIGNVFDFKTLQCFYDPNSEDDLQKQMFQGFYEEGDKDRATFWFKNKSPLPVQILSKSSCTTCSAARIANVSPELIDEFSKQAFISGLLAQPTFGSPQMLLMTAALQLDKNILWQELDVTGKTSITLNSNFSKQKPGLGVVQLQIKPSKTGSKTPSLEINASAGNEPQNIYRINMQFELVGGFAFRPLKQDIGELNTSVQEKSVEFISWSATRDFGPRFNAPIVKNKNELDQYASIQDGVPLNLEELQGLTKTVVAEMKAPVRILSGYKHKITIFRERQNKLADIGAFERMFLTAGSTETGPQLQVTGFIAGILRLADGKQIDFGTYEAKYEKMSKATLQTDQKNVELELLEGEVSPRFLKVTLDPAVDNEGIRSWKLNLKVNAGEGYRANWTGIIVLRTKGENAMTIRIPVIGNGVRR